MALFPQPHGITEKPEQLLTALNATLPGLFAMACVLLFAAILRVSYHRLQDVLCFLTGIFISCLHSQWAATTCLLFIPAWQKERNCNCWFLPFPACALVLSPIHHNY